MFLVERRLNLTTILNDIKGVHCFHTKTLYVCRSAKLQGGYEVFIPEGYDVSLVLLTDRL